MSKILSVFQKIASSTCVQLNRLEIPKSVVQDGVLNDRQESLKQIPFLTLKLPEIEKNQSVDSSYSEETGRGAIDVVNSKDYYLGEVL